MVRSAIVLGAVIIAGMALGSCRGPQQLQFEEFGRSAGEAKLTSLVSVLADPARFMGHRLRVQGVLNIEFEGNQLCLDRSSLQSFASANCVRLGLAEGLAAQEPELAHWNGHYATIEGTLQPAGDLDHFPARLDDVNHVLLVTSRRRLKHRRRSGQNHTAASGPAA